MSATPLLGDSELLWIARFDYAAGQRVAPHRHDYSQLILVIDGHGRIAIEGAERTVGPGDCCPIGPDREHQLHADSDLRSLDCKFRLRRPALAQAFAALPPVLAGRGRRWRAQLQEILDLAEGGGPLVGDRCAALLQVLLLDCCAQDRAEPTPVGPASWLPASVADPVVQALATVIDQRLAERLDGAALATATGYSYRHLAERCRQALGRTPRDLLLAARMARAQELLRYSDYPIKAIAGLVGSATVHHFTRIFTRQIGCSPAVWRQREARHIGSGIVLQPGFANINRVE